VAPRRAAQSSTGVSGERGDEVSGRNDPPRDRRASTNRAQSARWSTSVARVALNEVGDGRGDRLPGPTDHETTDSGGPCRDRINPDRHPYYRTRHLSTGTC